MRQAKGCVGMTPGPQTTSASPALVDEGGQREEEDEIRCLACRERDTPPMDQKDCNCMKQYLETRVRGVTIIR